MNDFCILTTPRCFLTQASLEDTDAIYEIINNEECEKNMPEFYSAFHRKKDVKRFIQTFSNYRRLGGGMLWTIKRHSSIIGFVGIMDIPDNATLFYATHPKYRNKGYMKESVMSCLRYFEERYSGMPIHTVVFEDNIPSLKILANTVVKIDLRNRSNPYKT